MTQQPRIAILGGGITGCVLAGELAGSGRFDVSLIERAPRLGGLHRSVGIDGLHYDIGTFVFHPGHTVFQTFPGLASRFVEVPSRFLSLRASGRVDGYPMTLRGYARDHGVAHLSYALSDLLCCKVRHCRRNTVPGYAKYYLGSTIYRESGLKAYIERLYSMLDTEVDPIFATKRLGLIGRWCSLRGIAASMLRGRRTVLRGTPALTPTDLVRPPGGFDGVYQAIGDEVKARGARVRTGCDIHSVRRVRDGFELDIDGVAERFDRVISTIPVPAMARLAGIPMRHELEYVKMVSLFYRSHGAAVADATVLHNFTPTGAWKRITFFSQYYGRCNGDHYFTAEIPVSERDDEDPDRHRTAFESHTRRLGIFPSAPRLQGYLVTRHAYPVYRRDSLDLIQEEKEKLTRWGLLLSGRQGEFDYISSSDAAGNARRFASELIASQGGIPQGFKDSSRRPLRGKSESRNSS